MPNFLSQDKSINMLAPNRIHATPIYLMWPNMHVYVEANYMLNTSYKYGYLYWLHTILFQVQNSANTHIYTSNQILTFALHLTTIFHPNNMNNNHISLLLPTMAECITTPYHFNFGHGWTRNLMSHSKMLKRRFKSHQSTITCYKLHF